MRTVSRPHFLMLLAMIFLTLDSVAFAGRPLLGRLRERPRAAIQNPPQIMPRRADPAPTRASGSRLPAGRNYYQGRYYGNLNNRFYGPQYGYF